MYANVFQAQQESAFRTAQLARAVELRRFAADFPGGGRPPRVLGRQLAVGARRFVPVAREHHRQPAWRSTPALAFARGLSVHVRRAGVAMAVVLVLVVVSVVAALHVGVQPLAVPAAAAPRVTVVSPGSGPLVRGPAPVCAPVHTAGCGPQTVPFPPVVA